MATSDSGRAAQECGGGAGARWPPSAPAITVTSAFGSPAPPKETRGMPSLHNMEKCGSTNLSCFGQVHPNLKQLERVRRVLVHEREHLRVDDAAPRRHPLHVAGAEACGGAERVRVVDEAAPHDGDRLEAAMGMLREAGHHVAVVHAPAVLALEVHPDPAPGKGRRRSHLRVAERIGVVMMDAEEERIDRGPGGSAERGPIENR